MEADHAPDLRIELDQCLETTLEITYLINSICFFLECVYILRKGESYQLIVLHNNKLLKEGLYQTLKGAKIAFSKSFRERINNHGARPVWTHFYEPDTGWKNLASNLQEN